MSEVICVCGHPKEYHDSPGNRINGGCAGPAGGEEYEHLDQACDCPCRMFLPAIPWPDEAGFWWCSDGAIVEVIRGSGSTTGLWVYEGDSLYETIEDWNKDHGIANPRFTKVERNPFPATD